MYSFIFRSPEAMHSFAVNLSTGGYLQVKLSRQLNESQMSFSLYLSPGDVLLYKGAGGDLHGVRMGDEL